MKIHENIREKNYALFTYSFKKAYNSSDKFKEN